MPVFSRFHRYFIAVGRAGSIRRAADELNVSASAIDRQILNVEAEIGMPLFERLPSGLRLTAAGEVMMAAATRWHKHLAEVRGQIEDLRGLKRGHVEIALIDALAKGAMPALIGALRQRYPGVTVRLRVLPNDAVRQAVASGAVDIGIFLEPQSYRDITVRAFVEVVLGLVVPPAHPLAALPEARFSACVGEPLIAPAEPLAVHQQVAVLEGITGLTLQATVTSDNIQMIISLVRAGVGIALLTSLDVADEAGRCDIAFVPIRDPALRPMTLALCTASARTPSHAAGVVLSEIEQRFAGFGYPAVNETG